jgi:transposase
MFKSYYRVLAMSFQGKEFTKEMKQLVVNLKEFYDIERRQKKLQSPWATEQTAKGLGVGEATVRRIMAEYNKNKKTIPDVPVKARGKPEYVVPQGVLPIVREYIRSQNLKGLHVSVDLVRNYLAQSNLNYNFSKITLWRALKRWGFTHGTGKRRSALKERDYVILARRRYLRHKRLNRNVDGAFIRPEVYLDETYINKNHTNQFTWYFGEDGPYVNKPSGKGERLIIVNAISYEGWVEQARLVFKAKRKTGDYHGQMDWNNFSRWFTDQLLPNIPENSIIIMDNASYHNVIEENVFPKANASKEKLRRWLDDNEIPWSEDLLKPELYKLCKLFEPTPEYKIDKLAEAAGRTILRTPQYHPELQPIEMCWGIMKNYMAMHCDFTLNSLRNNLPIAFDQISPQICQKLIAKAIDKEKKYWIEDEELDDTNSEIDVD